MHAVFGAGGTQPNVLRSSCSPTYFNLATRRINAGDGDRSKTADGLGLETSAGRPCSRSRRSLCRSAGNTSRYSDAIRVLDEINMNKSEVY